MKALIPIRFLIGCALSLGITISMMGRSDAQGLRVTFGSTPESIPGVSADGDILDPARPGFRVKVISDSAARCKLSPKFLPLPWPRALEMLKSGGIEAIFAASFNDERAGFAAFPLNKDQPDPSRAFRSQIYNLFVYNGSEMNWDGRELVSKDRRVIVERGSAAVELAKRFEAEAVQVSGYNSMLKMLSEKRAPGLIAVDSHIQSVFSKEPQLSKSIRRLTPPVEVRNSYVAFSKAFYSKHAEEVECFWKALADIRATESYKQLVRSYNNGEFIE